MFPYFSFFYSILLNVTGTCGYFSLRVPGVSDYGCQSKNICLWPLKTGCRWSPDKRYLPFSRPLLFFGKDTPVHHQVPVLPVQLQQVVQLILPEYLFCLYGEGKFPSFHLGNQIAIQGACSFQRAVIPVLLFTRAMAVSIRPLFICT